jgi:pyruvate/2-oxoglutarate dehydrogenase complex dihydrolipoamide dehydrogenase (E3) component
VAVTIVQSGEERVVTGSHLLVAVGRVPNSDLLDTEAAGIDVDDRGFITVDDYCRTSVDGVYAVGDINGRGAFTHTSVNDAEIVLDQMRGGSRKLSDRIPVYGLFIDPALGRVGMTEKEAVAKGLNVLKATRSMARISRAKEMGETQGFAKLVVDADTDLILGAAILGPGGDEIVNMFAAFMYSGLPCKTYRKSVLVHPTISELMPWVLDTLEPV